MVLGDLPVLGRATNVDVRGARAYCAFNRCGRGLFGYFSLIYHFSFLSPSLWEMAGFRLKYCLKGQLNPKQRSKDRKFENRVKLMSYNILLYFSLWKSNTEEFM